MPRRCGSHRTSVEVLADRLGHDGRSVPAGNGHVELFAKLVVERYRDTDGHVSDTTDGTVTDTTTDRIGVSLSASSKIKSSAT